MKNIKVVALSVVVVTLGAFAFFMPSTDDTAIKTIVADSKDTQVITAKSESDKRIAQQRLPVEHGIADENGRQVGVAPQRLRAAPPPPSSPSTDDRYRKTAHHDANEHGHERNHNSQSTDTPNSPPPPTGANKN